MLRARYLFLAVLSVLLYAGCKDSVSLIIPESKSPLMALFDLEEEPLDPSDTARVELKRPTVFLPPVAPAPTLVGLFDPELAPVVEICEASDAGCASVLARYTTTSGPGSETVRIDLQDEHYIVNWHTGRFGLDPAKTYRIRILVAGVETAHQDAKVVASAKDARNIDGSRFIAVVNGRTLPVKFWIQKVRRLTVVPEAGVEGTPPEQDTMYAYGTELPYSFTTTPGYHNLQVRLDGEPAPASGTLRMDRDHVLTASAEIKVTLPAGAEPLLESARAVLTSDNKLAAFQRHLDLTIILYDQIGVEAASARLDSVYALAFDPVQDSAAIRQAHLALANRTFTVRSGPPPPGSASGDSPGPLMSSAQSASSGRKTVFYTVNGVLNSPHQASQFAAAAKKAAEDASVLAPGDEFRLLYNATWMHADDGGKAVARCFQSAVEKLDFWGVLLLIPRLAACLVETAGLLIFNNDFSEALKQLLNVTGTFPDVAQRDARMFADTVRTRLNQGENLIFVPHSQGNLMMQEAFKHNRQHAPELQSRLCAGVVSLAAPVSGHFLLRPNLEKGVYVRHDVILLLPVTQAYRQIDTDRSLKAEREWNRWYWKVLRVHRLVKLIWRVKLHGSVDSYLAARQSRAWIVTAMRDERATLSAMPECSPVASVEVSPANATVDIGSTTQLSVSMRDAAGNALTGRAVTWTSSNPSVAWVSASGLVHGVANGTVTVTATSEGKSGTATVTVGGGGYLTGRVVHAETRAAISGATVTFVYGTSPDDLSTRSVTTAADGSYTSPGLVPGTYTIAASAPGYVGVTLYGAVVRNEQTTTLETIPLVPSSPYPGAVSGSIRDARHNGAIPGATVELRSGMNATDGPLVATTTSDSHGNYRFTGLPAGTYSIMAKASGFADGVQTGIVVGNKEIPGQNLSLSPATDDITIVLRWGATPRDLDSHLTGPTESGSRFHVYYASKGSLSNSPFAALDIDDVSSYGPETITISRQLAGTYRYSVHNYSNRWSNPSSDLAISGAQVKVYRGGTLLAEFNVPNEPGTLWTVFELDGADLRPINHMGYESSPYSIQTADGTDDRVIGAAIEENPKTK